MDLHLTSKLPNISHSIFTVMSKMAADYNAINLSQGYPDFPSDPKLIDLVGKYMKKGMNQYAPMQGVKPLLDSISSKVKELYNMSIDSGREINITSGATQAIYAAITAVINENDEVIVFEPAYDCYVPAIRLNGGIPIFIPLEAPDYKINWESVKNRINHKTKMIIINSPHNPTGTFLSQSDMEHLIKITNNTDIIVLSDEVYEHIIFDNIVHQSILKYPDLFKRSFVIFSFGKTYHNTGWKTGYCIAPEILMTEFRKVHQFIVFSSNTPIQYALAEYMHNKENYLQLASFYQEKRDYFSRLLEDSRFQVLPSSGTYFQLLRYDQISDEPDTQMAIRLTKDYKVASIPVSVFYSQKLDQKVLRFCFAKSNETLEKAAEYLCSIK
jgi:methionine transaminase